MKELIRSFLLAVCLLLGGTYSAWAYDTPDGYKVGTVYLGYEENNQVLAETFANCTNNADLTTLSTNWSSNVSGTSGYYWYKIKNTVRTVDYPATDRTTLYTCKKYTATNDGGTTNKTIYSDDGGKTYYTSKDLQSVFDATGYDVTENGTDYQIPTYVCGKCISLQHRNKDEFYLDYTLPTAVTAGKLVFGADFYRIQNANAPLYIQFYDSDNNLVFQVGHNNGSGRQTLYYKVGNNAAVAGAGYTEYRTYRGWGLKDMVFDIDAGTVSYGVDNVYYDGNTAAQRRKVTQSAINFGTGKNIKKVRVSMTGGASKANYDFFIDNIYLYTLVSESATTTDMTFIGSKDYEDGYLGTTSSDYTIKPNGKLHLQFKNYGSGAHNWNNWMVLFNNADKSSNLAYIRADAWELESSSNTGITTSSNYWDDFQTDMFGSTVVMDITRTDDDVNMVANITTTTSKVMSLTFNKAIGNAAEDIVFRLSEEAACLVLDNTKTALVAPPTFAQTSISNTGNPIITITENTSDSPTSGSAMYYTTDGSTPTALSSVYSDPVTVTGGNTIKAVTVVTASDGTTKLTSNASSLTTTAYIAGQTYDLSAATEAYITSTEGFAGKKTGIDYGVSSTSRFSKSDGKAALNIMGGLTTNYSGSNDTYWYWMLGQGIWQANGTRSVTLSNTVEGEVALFTQYDCIHDGTSWSASESEYYESDCSFTLNKSSNTNKEGNHVYMLKKVQSFVPAGTTISVPCTTGFATYANHDYALDFSNVSGLIAYKASVSDNVVTFTPVGKVPAGTGLLLKGETADVPVVGSADHVDVNLLYAPTTAITGNSLKYDDGENYNYILAQPAGKQIGFYRANYSNIAVCKAYLRIPKSLEARQFSFIGFDENGSETTGIVSVNNRNIDKMQRIYDLQGRRIDGQLSKGLYIVNGKKVIVK